MKGSCFLFTILLLLSACGSDEAIQEDRGLDYFPLQTGTQWIYEVEETNILFSVETKVNYELRVTLTDSIRDEAGFYRYTFVRETRPNAATAWTSLDTWSAWLTGNQLLQNESNISFVKLIFPAAKGLRWNGNLYNNLPDNGNLHNGANSNLYQLTVFDKPLQLASGLTFTKTLTVFQNDFVDPIVGTDRRSEVYARQTGLVRKDVTQLEYCSTPSCLGQQKIDKGIVYVQTLKSYVAK